MIDIKIELPKMVMDLVKEIDPEKIILFGSYAKGNQTPESNLDLLIIEKDEFNHTRNRWNELTRIRKILASYRIAKDILVFSKSEEEEWKNSVNHIISSALKEGSLLYERS